MKIMMVIIMMRMIMVIMDYHVDPDVNRDNDSDDEWDHGR